MSELKTIGANLIAGMASHEGSKTLRAVDPKTGEEFGPDFHIATDAEIKRAVDAAARATEEYQAVSPARRAGFLELIAEWLGGVSDKLIHSGHAETALPVSPRLRGEVGRTQGQLRMFARLLREGSWVDARIDHADPERKPPKPDIRRMLVPVGPVAVFGASNFPFAFSVAGGDTASALAAGCPVVVKAHPAHPATSQIAGEAIAAAANDCGMPSGVFSMLHGGAETGTRLALQEPLQAVAFTGSLRAGKALFDLANSRPRPIPVFAEMGSVNPVFLLPGALEANAKLAESYAASLTAGVGQFCTNPGLVIGFGSSFETFTCDVADHLSRVAPGTMLTPQIRSTYLAGCSSTGRMAAATPVFAGDHRDGNVLPSLFRVSAECLLEDAALMDELFGPAGIAVKCRDFDQMLEVAASLPGQLTASLHASESDYADAQRLLVPLTRIAGRVVFNGFPTGVEVCAAMQHGGPYPSTTDSRFTSVGAAAILRFARPVAYQDVPNGMLPDALKDGNPLGIWRMVNESLGR